MNLYYMKKERLYLYIFVGDCATYKISFKSMKPFLHATQLHTFISPKIQFYHRVSLSSSSHS